MATRCCDWDSLGLKSFIEKVQRGEQTAITSALTYDEIVWAVRKILGKEAAARAAELFLFLPHLGIREVRRETIIEAHDLMKHFNLKPRDAIHLATMRLENETEIISEDPDFDIVPEIKRIML
ncbi:type II toxin-antitoxin system VapC family toxin [Candidatus Woesearchaeota archaeon]|nr:type II toxin-antitoxin system VapC family toxin [Candidatus Woesearchaeota archaeon]